MIHRVGAPPHRLFWPPQCRKIQYYESAVTGQELSVVSDIKGTTTDPVYKSMFFADGPCGDYRYSGFDDEGALRRLRVKKTREILNRADCAVLGSSLQGKTGR